MRREETPSRVARGEVSWVPASDERVSFEQHIEPLFRPVDYESMAWAFDLSSSDEVKDHATRRGLLVGLALTEVAEHHRPLSSNPPVNKVDPEMIVVVVSPSLCPRRVATGRRRR
jgi:hypothetical protein